MQLVTAATGNFDNNGLRDLIQYLAAIKLKIYIPNHIPTGTRARAGSLRSVYAGYVSQMDLMGVPQENRPCLHWLADPVDYLKQIVYDIDTQAWSNPAKQEILSGHCAPSGATEPVVVLLD